LFLKLAERFLPPLMSAEVEGEVQDICYEKGNWSIKEGWYCFVSKVVGSIPVDEVKLIKRS